MLCYFRTDDNEIFIVRSGLAVDKPYGRKAQDRDRLDMKGMNFNTLVKNSTVTAYQLRTIVCSDFSFQG